MAKEPKFGLGKYVLRNITRRRLRSTITVVGIAIVLAFFVLFASISQGLKEDILEEIEDREAAMRAERAGYVTVINFDLFGENYFNDTNLEELEDFVHQYCKDHNTTGEVYPLSLTFLASQEKERDPYMLFGIDPQKGVKVEYIYFNGSITFSQGEFFDEDSHREIILGRDLWEREYEDYQVGDQIDVRVLAFMGEGETVIRNVTIRGIADSNFIFNSIGAVPVEFLLEETGGYNETMQEYRYYFASIWIKDASKIDFGELRYNVREITGVGREAVQDNERDLNAKLESHEKEIEAQKEQKRTVDGWMYVAIMMLSLITVFFISITMIISVSERRREIGTMKAVGITRGGVYAAILTEAVLLLTVAIMIGSVVGGSLAYYFNSQFEAEAGGLFFAPASVTPMVFVNAALIGIVATVLAALYPARSAANLNPTEALRYE